MEPHLIRFPHLIRIITYVYKTYDQNSYSFCVTYVWNFSKSKFFPHFAKDPKEPPHRPLGSPEGQVPLWEPLLFLTF